MDPTPRDASAAYGYLLIVLIVVKVTNYVELYYDAVQTSECRRGTPSYRIPFHSNPPEDRLPPIRGPVRALTDAASPYRGRELFAWGVEILMGGWDGDPKDSNGKRNEAPTPARIRRVDPP